MSGPVRIASGDLAATIAPLGAELQSLTDSAGREYMTDADPRWWTGHAPLLFPIVGRLNGDALRIDGREYAMKQHGFARRMAWELVEQTSASARFRLADDEQTRAVYPFAFAIVATYELTGSTLLTTITVSNPGDEPLPFSFGFHPAFAWPLPGGGDKLAHRIVFEQAERAPIRRLDADGLLAVTEPSPVEGKQLALAPDLFAADAMIWDAPASRRLAYRGENGAALDIAYPDLPMLGIWQKPGANFVCIEPWAGIADPAGFGGDFREKPGVMQLAAGEECSFRMDVTVHPA
ncbi:aldose 1-epimerase family protein [Aurantiacibacter suaedae]|uniref:aldose 1-epimerase family protein n=1 Tax=Aurantiacibacter suaedae TaxID=2545755 RepID=UPI0010F87E36|nr:aldose 1-epimerase family protein [Aurantiacibacter suaedae]